MVNEWMQSARSRLQTWILPPSCILCGDRGQAPLLDLCAPCAADFPANPTPCPLCAEPMPHRETSAWPCHRCLVHKPPFDRAIAPFLYGYPLDHLLHALKYGGVLAYGRVLGTLLAYRLRARNEPLPQAIVPVPLHPARHRERGFNQSFELARPLAQFLAVPIAAGLVRRRRNTADQTELNAAERRRNLRGAFALEYEPEYAHVAIVDDVLTTGSTAGELARVLKAGGVSKVEVWTIARAVRT